MRRTASLILFLTSLWIAACGGQEAEKTVAKKVTAPPEVHPLLARLDEVAVDAAGEIPAAPPPEIAGPLTEMAKAAGQAEAADAITVDYPLDGSVFPPEFISPTFLWHDSDTRADTWLVTIGFANAGAEPIQLLVPGAPPPKARLDEEALGPTNEPYLGTDYQNSARSWTPSRAVWEALKSRSVEAVATVTFTGFDSSDPATPLSRGSTRVMTSKDPVGAPFFYRDVPLMPSVGESGRIQPLGASGIPLIAWRLRDVSKTESKLVLKGMSSCGNCHSFSMDGKTLGMDLDGPSGDKGMYAIKDVSKNMEITQDDVITWNSYPDKIPDHKTIGFLSRVSPDGQFVVSTVNEEVYVSNFPNYKFLQVFYPTRGIFAYYSRERDEIKALPGADDPNYVHCNPAWTPDGKGLVFCRGVARDPYDPELPPATYPNDPNEVPMKYDLYRMPFDSGKGGTPVPIEGASNNGMSNSFPKVTPDGKWVVFVKAKNGLLMRPDGRLWIVPITGGEAREMRCNTELMNSWHSFSPNGRWMVFSSKSNTPYTQAFLTHLDENGNDTPPILVPNCTAPNRAVNIPEFLNAPYEALDTIDAPVVAHHDYLLAAVKLLSANKYAEAAEMLQKAIVAEPTLARAHFSMALALVNLDGLRDALPHFAIAAEYDRMNATIQFSYARACIEARQPYRAVQTLEHLIDIAPYYPQAQELLAQARTDLEWVNEKIVEVEKDLEANPKSAEVCDLLANLYDAAGRVKEATSTLARAVELAPDNLELVTSLAWVLGTNPDHTIRDGARAIDLAKRAVELSEGKRPECLDVLAAAYAECGRFEEAVETAERAVALAKPDNPVLAASIQRRLNLYLKGLSYHTGPTG